MKEIKDLGFGIIQVDELKPTMSKIKSVDNYLCKWQKLKEILKRQIDIDSKEYLESGFPVFKNYVTVENFVLQKMQELEGEDENTRK